MEDQYRQTRYAEINGQKIAYHRAGSGEPLICIHGITTYSFIWRNLAPQWWDNYDVIALDLLGCGESDKPTEVDYSIKAQADVVLALADSLGIGEFHLVSHDIGGGVAQIMAVTVPKRIKSMVLINSIGYDYWPVQPIITMRIPVLRQLAMASLDMGILRMLVRHGVFHKDRVTDELMEMYFMPLREPEGRRGFLRLARCLNNKNLMDIVGDLKSIDVPTLVVRGDSDPYLGPEISERLAADIRGAALVRMPAGGHFIMEDEPERLASVISEFIAQKAAAAL